eukprot:scaffold1234_cov248-Pinguiococcus_pyrenoidosus.AAC.5
MSVTEEGSLALDVVGAGWQRIRAVCQRRSSSVSLQLPRTQLSHLPCLPLRQLGHPIGALAALELKKTIHGCADVVVDAQ